MKLNKLLALALTLAMALSLAGCGRQDSSNSDSVPDSSSQVQSRQNTPDTDTLWENALYKEDTRLGEGEKTLALTVTMGDKSVVLTVKTDSETLGEVLREHSLAEGEDSEYGWYVKSVLGVRADYETDGAYWAVLQNGEFTSEGVDGCALDTDCRYQLMYTPA